MFQKFKFVLLFISLTVAAQEETKPVSKHKTVRLNNYSVDVEYGLTGFINSDDNKTNIINLGHTAVGFKMMKGKTWGLKLDFGMDKTIVDRNGISSGCDYKRFSLQTICVLNNLFDSRENIKVKNLNLIGHFGGGYSNQTSTILSGVDNMGNIIFGLNPQYRISKQLKIGLDVTGVINFSRQFDFNGKKILNGEGISETGFMYNSSLTLNWIIFRKYNKSF